MSVKRLTGDTPEVETPAATPEQHHFTVTYACPDGAKYHATVTSHIPDFEDKGRIGRIAAQLAGAKWETLPEDYRDFCDALSQVTVRCKLNSEDSPDWLATWVGKDEDLLYSLYGEVMRHERRFFRNNAGEGEGDSEEPRVRVAALATPPA